ncbi:hypothetical protein KP509_01G018600 [Ceratopteris richardii]|nr:hypothetical protein KP509_01G018600 [Ceratopteris richardii]
MMGPNVNVLDQFFTLSSLPSDKATISTLIRKCGDAGVLSEGKRLHSHIMSVSSLANDTLLGNLLVQMYSKCNSLNDALGVFANIHHKNVYSWALILGACIQHGKRTLALELFHQLRTEGVVPDKVTYVTILDACDSSFMLSDGELIHAQIIEDGFEMDVYVGTALSSMYGRCDALDATLLMFERIPSRNEVSWNAIISACVQAGDRRRALQIFQVMMQRGIKPSNLSFVTSLEACETVQEALYVHECIRRLDFESDTLVSTALITTYGKLGRIDDARKVFENIVMKSTAAWSAMIAVYVQQERSKEALELFYEMELNGLIPTQYLLTSGLSACARESILAKGELMYTCAVLLGWDHDTLLVNALIDMYANCGYLEVAQEIFDNMIERDASSWNVITGAHSLYGNAICALKLFQEMMKQGTKPDAFTFSNLLSAFSHAGFVNEAHHYFLSMQSIYGIIQKEGHYNCLIDLLARVGRLDESEYLLNHMPYEPTTLSWMSFFNGCKLHNDMWRAN